MLKKILLTVVAIAALGQNLYAVNQYHKYGEWHPGGHGVSDVGGFIDNNGLLGGANGDEYIFFRENNTGYIYRVSVAGDPNAHPDVNGQPIATRTFTYVNEFPVTFARATWSEFYIDDTGIYYGSGQGIKKWSFNLLPQPDAANGGVYSGTLARNTTTGEWWTATGNREVHKYNNTTNTWEYQFTYPDLAGSHHDGMEIINNQLFISDMTSDKIIIYDINPATGEVDNPALYQEYSYTSAPDVEGMGFGPNQHFWMASGWGGTVYEIGNGDLRPTCSQTFHYATQWQMSRSECDNISVPAFDDTVLVTYANSQILFTTDDNGAYTWLQTHGYNVNRQAVTLHSGQGFFTLGKDDTIDKIIDNGELTNSFVNFHNGIYSLIGFSLATNLNSKFAGKPVESISYYINGSWKQWTPINPNINNNVPPSQALYVLPDGDFGILVN